jgi:hypothetical protein
MGAWEPRVAERAPEVLSLPQRSARVGAVMKWLEGFQDAETLGDDE